MLRQYFEVSLSRPCLVLNEAKLIAEACATNFQTTLHKCAQAVVSFSTPRKYPCPCLTFGYSEIFLYLSENSTSGFTIIDILANGSEFTKKEKFSTKYPLSPRAIQDIEVTLNFQGRKGEKTDIPIWNIINL